MCIKKKTLASVIGTAGNQTRTAPDMNRACTRAPPTLLKLLYFRRFWYRITPHLSEPVLEWAGRKLMLAFLRPYLAVLRGRSTNFLFEKAPNLSFQDQRKSGAYTELACVHNLIRYHNKVVNREVLKKNPQVRELMFACLQDYIRLSP